MTLKKPGEVSSTAVFIDHVVAGVPTRMSMILNETWNGHSSGNRVDFRKALQANCQYASVEHVNYGEMERREEAGRGSAETEWFSNVLLCVEKATDNIIADTVRLFIGITSACCSEKSRKRRQIIRETWMQDAVTQDNVEIKFFIGYPDPCTITIPGLSSWYSCDFMPSRRGHGLHDTVGR